MGTDHRAHASEPRLRLANFPFDPARVPIFYGTVVLVSGFFAMRFFGQGMLTLSSRNMVLEWFEKRRGMALAFVGISIAFGFSLTPPFFEWLIQRGGWTWAWQVIAVLLVAYSAIAFCFGRSRPEDHGMLPDGPYAKKMKRKSHAETLGGRQFTLSEARRTYSFWVFTFSVVLAAFVLASLSNFLAAGLATSSS